MFDEISNLAKFLNSERGKVCKYCRSLQELSNENLLAKVGFDAAENEPLNVSGVFNVHNAFF